MNKCYRINDIENNLQILQFRPLDVLVVGGTGAGKSSTLNALFQEEVARVGRSCDPETMDVSSAKLNDCMRFWDSPGLGDNVVNDKLFSKKLIDLLYKTYYMDNNNYGLIDLVLVILDGSVRDMGTTYKLLNEVIAPNFQIDRVLVAINQADIAMKGRHWDYRNNRPDSELLSFLNDKANSVRDRLFEATRVRVEKPVFYSAECGYNINKLLDMIIDNMPKTRRKLVS